MTTTEQPPTSVASLAKALAQVQAAIPCVAKDNVGVVKSDKANYKYNYADLSDVTAAILPLLGRNGLAWTTLPMLTTEGRFVLRYTLMHSSGESVSGDYPLPDPSRATPQQIGSALTYGRRYSLCAVTGVAPGGDDDDAAAAQPAPYEQQWSRQRHTEPARTAKPAQAAQRDRPPPPSADSNGGRMTQPQQGRLFALVREAEITDRNGWASQLLGRDIASFGQLTTADAAALIENLEAALGDDPPS